MYLCRPGRIDLLGESRRVVRSFTNRFQLAEHGILNASNEQFMHGCRHTNDKPVPFRVVIIPVHLSCQPPCLSCFEHTHRILSSTNPSSSSSRSRRRCNLSYSPGTSENSVHGSRLLCFPARISWKSAMTRGACANGFSSVGGGVNGGSAKLEGGVIFCFGSRSFRVEDIAVCRMASRRRTSAVATTARGLGILTLWPLWLTQQ